MKLPRVSGWLWVVWAGSFFVLEGLALANGPANGDTLTENILTVLPGFVIYSGLGWLLWHFRKAR